VSFVSLRELNVIISVVVLIKHKIFASQEHNKKRKRFILLSDTLGSSPKHSFAKHPT
jgi:hypothetical protein